MPMKTKKNCLSKYISVVTTNNDIKRTVLKWQVKGYKLISINYYTNVKKVIKFKYVGTKRALKQSSSASI